MCMSIEQAEGGSRTGCQRVQNIESSDADKKVLEQSEEFAGVNDARSFQYCEASANDKFPGEDKDSRDT